MMRDLVKEWTEVFKNLIMKYEECKLLITRIRLFVVRNPVEREERAGYFTGKKAGNLRKTNKRVFKNSENGDS